MPLINNIQSNLKRVPSPLYLGIGALIFAASGSVTRKVIEIGQQHLIDGKNPISPCNVLFVGNICALGLMILIFHQDWKKSTLKMLTRKNWISLTLTGILSGAIAPALIFTALEHTSVTNIVLIGRIEPILSLGLNFWLLGSRFNLWTILGSLVSFLGAVTTIILGSSGTMIMLGLHVGKGDILVIIATIIGTVSTIIGRLQLQSIPVGIYTIYRNILGTVIFFLLANILYGPHHFSEVSSAFLWQWMIIYAVIIIVLGQLCWLAGLKNSTSTELNLASLFNPIAAIAMAYLILGEVPSFAQYVGGSLLLIGIILSFIGNFYQVQMNRRLATPNPREAMATPMGFRGV